MFEIPNLNNLRTLVGRMEEEYDIKMRLNRYKSLTELLNLASNEGLPDANDAVIALFVADFIVTASELPTGGTDEERYKSVLKSFIIGRGRCNDFFSLMKIYYLAYKLATTIRRQDLFLAGRGLAREAALLKLKDAYLVPYLAVSSEVLTPGNCGWELGVLAAALKRTYPDVEINQYKNAPKFNNYELMTSPIWKVLKEYENIQSVDTNPNATIPNIDKSNSILLLNSNKLTRLALWETMPKKVSAFQTALQLLVQALNIKLDGKPLLMLRAVLPKSQSNLFIVQDPFITSRPIFIVKTIADELNLSQLMPVLEFRGLEDDGWKFLSVQSSEKPKKEQSEEVLPPPKVKIIQEEAKSQKKGFFANIRQKFNIIIGKQDPLVRPIKNSSSASQPIIAQKPKKIQKVGFSTYTENSYFLAQGVTVDAVAGLDLVEQFDTVREEEKGYHILSIFEVNLKNAKTTILTHPGKDLSAEVVKFLNKLSKVNDTITSIYEKDEIILFTEIFLMDEQKFKLLITMSGNQKRVVGTCATSQFDKIADWQSRGKETEPLQRRSLQMRITQFISARRHTAFTEAVDRIFHDNFDLERGVEQVIDTEIEIFSKLGREDWEVT